MTGRIIIKTVHGRQYRYERISTKRKNGKVVTNDKYLGPVTPTRRGRKSKMAGVPTQVCTDICTMYAVGESIPSIRQHLQDRGHQIGDRALRNWLKAQETSSDIGETRGFMATVEGGTESARKRGWATRRRRAAEAGGRDAAAQAREREDSAAIEEVLRGQLEREEAEAARLRRDAGEWQQRFRKVAR